MHGTRRERHTIIKKVCVRCESTCDRPQYACDWHVITSIRCSPPPHQLYTLTSHSSLIHCQRARSLPSLSSTLQTFTSCSRFGPGVTQCELLTVFLRQLPGLDPQKTEDLFVIHSNQKTGTNSQGSTIYAVC